MKLKIEERAKILMIFRGIILNDDLHLV